MFTSLSQLILAMISIQFGAALAKNLFLTTGVWGTSLLRLSLASLILSLFFKPWRHSPTKFIIFYGMALGLMNLTFYFALERIPLGIAVALEFSGPLMVSLLGKRKSKIHFIWPILAGLGIFFLTPNDWGPSQLDPWGIFFALLAGLFWGLYIVLGKKASLDLPSSVVSTQGMIFATLVVLLYGLVKSENFSFSFEVLPSAMVMAIFASALPYWLEMRSLKKISPSTFGIFMSLEPVLASLIGMVMLKENLTFHQWGAILCVLSASLGFALTNRD